MNLNTKPLYLSNNAKSCHGNRAPFSFPSLYRCYSFQLYNERKVLKFKISH